MIFVWEISGKLLASERAPVQCVELMRSVRNISSNRRKVAKTVFARIFAPQNPYLFISSVYVYVCLSYLRPFALHPTIFRPSVASIHVFIIIVVASSFAVIIIIVTIIVLIPSFGRCLAGIAV